MELYLDSADLNEIEQAFSLGFLKGLTTTPTFMQREGVTDVDEVIKQLAVKVPVLQIEALGGNADEIRTEAHRLLGLGLKKNKTVFKIPVSLEGVKACHKLVKEGMMVNIHLVYTLQQAYMAMSAGASYVCPLVGRLQDQGHNALELVEQCVDAITRYKYKTKVMFSSVRHAEHIRNAINIGAHSCTIPWKIMRELTENHFTSIGTQKFKEDTRLVTLKVQDVISKSNPFVYAHDTIVDALVEMTRYGFGAVSILDKQQNIRGVFTDGDLRRLMEKEGDAALTKRMWDLKLKYPSTIKFDAPLNDAHAIFREKEIDNIIVVKDGKPVGMLDIQDLLKTEM